LRVPLRFLDVLEDAIDTLHDNFVVLAIHRQDRTALPLVTPSDDFD
jgi:hypothetical protein